jgi:hypothetical protein
MLDKNGQPSPKGRRFSTRRSLMCEHPLIVVGYRGSSKQGCPFLSSIGPRGRGKGERGKVF